MISHQSFKAWSLLVESSRSWLTDFDPKRSLGIEGGVGQLDSLVSSRDQMSIELGEKLIPALIPYLDSRWGIAPRLESHDDHVEPEFRMTNSMPYQRPVVISKNRPGAGTHSALPSRTFQG